MAAHIPEHRGGLALDLGGGNGESRLPLTAAGYSYINIDLAPCPPGCSVKGDAHSLPFASGVFDLVCSEDSLEHFREPLQALTETKRVMAPGGRLVVWVPFMHPFHGDDYFRFSPAGLHLLFGRAGLSIIALEAPLWVFTIAAYPLLELTRRLHLSGLIGVIRSVAAWLDRVAIRFQGKEKSLAAAYLVIAEKNLINQKMLDARR